MTTGETAAVSPAGRTLIDKIWDNHVIATDDGGQSLLYVDRHLIHDGSAQSFERLELEGHGVRSPERTFGVPDHYVPTRGGRNGFVEPASEAMVTKLARNAERFGITHFGLGDPAQGIAHVVGPELGLTLPGSLLICGDSHTSTHGALGAFAFGVGATEVAHVLATQTLWQTRPRRMRIMVGGRLADGVSPKDLALYVVATLGTDGATGYVVEYAGPAVVALSLEGRLTLCNMSIEAGARAGLVAPDDTTYAYLAGRRYAPVGDDWNRAVAFWRTLASDADAVFDREIAIDAAAIMPMVTWGTSPDDAVAITGAVPDPAGESDPTRRARWIKALEYMDLAPGTPVTDISVDQVFIGSCANGRIEDLRAAAAILQGRRVKVPIMVVPGSGAVKAAAEREGLDRIFRESGAEWRDPGCSMCVAINGTDVLAAGTRCASTSNRNFPGRQGRGARTHLMSPAMAAVAALTGRISDPREFAATR